jgi:hypothetical protein
VGRYGLAQRLAAQHQQAGAVCGGELHLPHPRLQQRKVVGGHGLSAVHLHAAFYEQQGHVVPLRYGQGHAADRL